MVGIYDQKGKLHEKAPVDARELLAQGWTFDNQAEDSVDAEAAAEAEAEALRATLLERKVEHHPMLGLTKLRALVADTEPQADPDLSD